MVSGIAFVCSSTFFTAYIQAAEIEENKNSTTALSESREELFGIVDVDKSFDKMAQYYYFKNLQGKIENGYKFTNYKGSSTNLDKFKTTSDKVSDLQITGLLPEYIGGNTFPNHTEQEQTFSTTSYARTITESVTTTTQSGFSVSGQGGLLNIPIIFPNGTSITASINTSSTLAKQESDTRTLTAPSQAVKVPPGKTYRAEVKLVRKSFKANVGFNGTIAPPLSTDIKMNARWEGAGGRPNKTVTKSYATQTLYRDMTPSQQKDLGITFNSTTGQFDVNGKAVIDGIAGSEMEVAIYDITNARTPKLVSKTYY